MKPDADVIPPARMPLSCESDLRCGAASSNGSSCCESIWLSGGTFPMGFDPKEVPFPQVLQRASADHPVTVSGFYLDRFEITVGRYAAFARHAPPPPADGDGAHPQIANSGWHAEWDARLDRDVSALLPSMSTGLEAVAADLPSDPNLPMTGLDWFTALAFCVWDGGRLPTEAEWEFAAAGGELNRSYPWGADPSLITSLRESGPRPVGSSPETRGAFGHEDLAGSAEEWTLDWYDAGFYERVGAQCRDCANLSPQLGRVVRGARDSDCCAGMDSLYRSASRAQQAPGMRQSGLGARCARDPQTVR
ncbi:MAG TPA: SUMF1/EgtB/PvdO family nonheme iron enzyme [Polyangiaceae bacterium]|nr:SUMF1/EgtB/PvdO family nonheme iron enzyme [Polyangiaceae bacterium]